jgi:hypothetical protein
VRTELVSNPFEKKGRSRGLLVGLVVVLVGAGATYAVAAQRHTTPLALIKSTIGSLRGGSDTTASSQFSVKEDAPPKVDSPAAAPAAPKPVSPSNLPAAAIAPAEATDILADGKSRAGKSAAKVEKASPAVAAAPAAPAAEPKEAPAPKQAAQPEPTGLAGAIKKAVGPTDQAAKDDAPAPAAAAPVRGDIPEAPPQGAIQGALGSVRGAARSCVAGHDAPSRATITFASSGKVQSVSVSGPAAGTPAEACIKSVLSKANVGAFQRSSFPVSTTISPP